MNYKEYRAFKKVELKALAQDIRELKHTIKEAQRNAGGAWKYQYKLPGLKSDFRHKHIAYCLARGKSYEQIENKTREGNEPNFDYIEKLVKEYEEKRERTNETVICHSA